MRLDARRPTYKLDHLIRERYPTFADALTELDDAICLVFLFASLSPSKFVHAPRIQACSRLRREFLAYVARTRSLRAVFISIKGIYYKAARTINPTRTPILTRTRTRTRTLTLTQASTIRRRSKGYG